MKLQHYTLRYLAIAILFIIAVWAGLFYAYITEEVYDNIDDGLKNLKLHIIREAQVNPEILNTHEYGINQFKITHLPKGNYVLTNTFETSKMFMEYDDDYEPIRKLTCVFNYNNGESYQLEIITSMIEEDELLQNMLVGLLVLYIMLVSSIILLNHVLLKKIWRSFFELLDKLKNYQITSNQSFDITQSPIEEFNNLGREMQSMIVRTEKTFKSQKLFIENASHELQTPLSIVRNKLELLAENSNSEQQLAEISTIIDAVNRMIQLNKSLLTLSRVENQQYNNTRKIDLCEITDELLIEYDDLITYKKVNITKSYTQHFFIDINETLARMLINNLIRNAIIHNYPNGDIIISSESNKIIFKNTGINEPLDKESIFNRFYKGTTNEQSTGLGLAIIKSIIDSYPYIEINYYYENGHCFEIISKQ